MNNCGNPAATEFTRTGSIVAFDALWQTPAITEKYAYDRLLTVGFNYPHIIYFAFPWASLIDGKNRGTSLGMELQAVLASANRRRNKCRTITVCQHIKFRDFIAEFKQAGITDLYASHAKKGEYVIEGIKVHPFPLYPVQLPEHKIWQNSNQAQVESFLDRKYLFSFMGAFDLRHYLTRAREWIFQLPSSPRGFIKNRKAWHYDHRVYQEQVLRDQVPEAKLIEERCNAIEFKKILRATQFSLCPSGSGPNSIRLWESIEFGAIPVILADDLRLPGDEKLWEKACVIVEEKEDTIRDVPTMLESLSNDREKLETKLGALRTLKQRYGHDGFVNDILEFSAQVPALATTQFPATTREHRFYLSINEVDDEVALAWVEWIRDVCQSLSLRATICLDRELGNQDAEKNFEDSVTQTISGDSNFPITDDWAKEDLITVSDSRVLSRGLLQKFDRISIRSQRKPTQIHGSLYDALAIAQKNESNRLMRSWSEPVNGEMLWRPKCSLLTSMFNGDEYVEGFLQNSQALEGYSDIEHFIVRPASPGHEHVAVCKHLDANPSVVYIWLHKDPGLYEVWNLCCRLSGAPYLSNANIDDRRAPEHVAQLIKLLDEHPDVDVASAALRVTATKNLTWAGSESCEVWYANEPSEKYSVERLFKQRDGQLISYNSPHCMPLWRRSLHVWNGWFDERRFGPSADWEFWLRAGKSGAKFFIHPQPLGLYLRVESSYWRRTGSAIDYDQYIVALHSDAVAERHNECLNPLYTPRVQSMLQSRRRGDALNYLSSLCNIAAEVERDTQKFPALEKLIDMLARRDLGLSSERLIDWQKEAMSFSSLATDRQGLVLRLVLDALHEPRELKQRSTVLHKTVKQALDQMIDLAGATASLVVGAFVAHLEQDNAAERHFLERAYAIGDPEFWSKLQAAYRFTRPLRDLCEDIGGLPAFTELEELEPGQRLFFFPDYTHGNPYQTLLYGGLVSRGVRTKGINELAALLVGREEFSAGDVLHIHWFNILYKGIEPERYAEVLEKFLDQVDQLKSAGMRILWTVHNRYSHDLEDVSLERMFQRRLCERADILLLHHPCLLAELTDWLPPDAPVRFLEHGNYIGVYPNELDQFEARKQLNLEPDDLVIGVIGQIRPYKGLAEVLPALRQAMRDNSRLKLVVAGKVSCEATRVELTLMPSSQVVLRDSFIDDSELQIYLNAADFVLLSYRAILTPGSLFQAFSFSKPVIAPRRGSIPSYVVDGYNGFLWNSAADIWNIVQKIHKAYKSNSLAMQQAAYRCGGRLYWPGSMKSAKELSKCMTNK